jgi:thiosulfate/3-mercaptopyruvate sulfurtransferase
MGEADVRIVDVRWRLGDPDAGPAAYARAHIPGAVFAHVDRDLAGPVGEGDERGLRGRHPLPTPEAFADVMGRLGIDDDTRVVAYDDQGGATAARLWFLLRYFGHETCAVLDGGLQAFANAGHTLDTSVRGSSKRPPAFLTPQEFHARPRPELVVSRDAVASTLGSVHGLLLDARAPERYRGEVETVDRRAGHIPGAVSAPYAANLKEGYLLPPEALRERYTELGVGVKDTTVYCGSGVTACHDLLALAVAGLPEAKLYAGSWSEWSMQPDAPVETT